MAELDLEIGDDGRADELTAREKRRKARENRATRESTGGTTPKSSDDKGLVSRLTDLFDRIAVQLREREDEELASAVSEDGSKMAQGLVSLTKAVPILRIPLVVAVGFIEPILAFYRVGAILFRRFLIRRQARWDEAQAQENMMTPEEYAQRADVFTPVN